VYSSIQSTRFGSITVGGREYDHDIVICVDGTIAKRKERLSKAIHGTSHILSLREADYVYQDGAKVIVIGSGQSGALELSPEAERYFAQRSCTVKIHPTPEAIDVWNAETEPRIGLFHVTC